MQPSNLLYAQSGGVTTVINSTACAVIRTAREYKSVFNKIYCAKNGILGVLNEELIDTSHESDADIAKLKFTPGGAFGSCRYKLKDYDKYPDEYHKLIQVFKAHNIGYFLYNGGGDSQDTAHKISQISKNLGYQICCIGIPKTIDNDLAVTDNSPGFGSVAKYVSISIKEATLDLASMASSSTQVFVMEVMGRHTGWIAAASGLAKNHESDGPHIILLPEVAFNKDAFLTKVKSTVEQHGHCSIVVAEGIRDKSGTLLTQSSSMRDSFGHVRLGGVAPLISNMIQHELDYKYHWAVLDYLQRSARHIASTVDLDQAYALGEFAVKMALENKNAKLPVIIRDSNKPYKWHIEEAPLSEVANIEKIIPREFITDDGFGITEKAREYLLPLIQGESYPDYLNGTPDYVKLKNKLVPKILD